MSQSRQHLNLTLFLALTLAASIISMPIRAQENPNDGTAQETKKNGPSPTIEPRPTVEAEIVVTATKRGQVRAQETATSLTSFDEEKLERLGAVDLEDFIVHVPGTNFIDNGGPGRGHEISSIRGLSPVADNTAAVVACSLDGAPRVGSNYRLFDIDEVSVLRGPQGTLWGSQAIGGLILYHSRRPDPSMADVRVDTELYGTARSSGMSRRLTAAVGLPIIDDRLAIRLAAQDVDETGYVDNTTTGDDDVNSVRETSWRLSLVYRPSDSLSLTAIAHGSDLVADAPTFFNPDLGRYRSDAPLASLPADQSWSLYNLIIDADLGWAGLSYTGAYLDLDNVASDATRHTFGFIPAARTDTVLTQESWTHELRLRSLPGGRLSWIVGLYSDQLDEVAQDRTIEVPDPGGAPAAVGIGQILYSFGGPQSLKERAIFGELGLELGSAWQVLAGARLFRWEVDNDQDTVFLGTSFGQETGTVGDDDSFFKLQLSYRPARDKLLYVMRSEGFRIGGFNPFVGPAWNSSLDFIEFDPDRLINYELGLKSTWLDDRLLVNAAVFHMDWRDVQVVVFDSVGVYAFTANAADLEAEGLEIELATQDLGLPGLYGAASLTHMDNHFTGNAAIYPGVGLLVRRGDSLRRTPASSWSLDIGYERVLTRAMTGFVHTSYWHRDATTTEGYNRNDGAVPVPAHDVVNASLGIRRGRWELELACENMSDAAPFLQVFPGASRGSGEPGQHQATRVSSIRPRTISLRARWRLFWEPVG